MCSPSRIASLVMVLLCAWMAAPAAVADTYLDRFDTAAEGDAWTFSWGGATQVSIGFDQTMDADGNAQSGSLKVVVTYDAAITCDTGCNQVAFSRGLAAAADWTDVGSVEMDVYVDPSSPTRPGPDYGDLGVGTRDGDNWVFNQGNTPNVTTSATWTHIVTPANSFANGPHNDVRAITMQNWGGADLTGTMILWIDNIKLVSKLPPPGALVIANDFNTADEVTAWLHGHDPANINEVAGGPVTTVEWDPAVDDSGPAGSGAMKVTMVFDSVNNANHEVQITRDFGAALPVDLRDYTQFTARVRLDPNATNPASAAGFSGCGTMIFRLTVDPWWESWLNYCNGLVSTQNNGWNILDVTLPNATSPPRSAVGALTFVVGAWPDYWTMDGTLTVWVDHITFGRQLPCVDPSGLCEVCGDGIDNNGNGLVDCADPDCHGGNLCPLETACADGIDNNGDGLIDCLDPDCAQDPNCKRNAPWADLNGDGAVDMVDFSILQRCYTGSVAFIEPGCGTADHDLDRHVTSFDYAAWMSCWSGPSVPPDPNCP